MKGKPSGTTGLAYYILWFFNRKNFVQGSTRKKSPPTGGLFLYLYEF